MSPYNPSIADPFEAIPQWVWDQVADELPAATDDEAQKRAEAILDRRDSDARNDDGGM